jgi:hypothetical protein
VGGIFLGEFASGIFFLQKNSPVYDKKYGAPFAFFEKMKLSNEKSKNLQKK